MLPHNSMKTHALILTFLVSFLFVGASSINAAVLLNETFSAGIPANWQTANSAQVWATDSSVPPSGLDGNSLRHTLTSSSGNYGGNGIHYSQFTATTLGVEESLTLTFDFKGISYAQNAGNFFNFGFMSSTTESFDITQTFGYAAALRMDPRTDQTVTRWTLRSMDGPTLAASPGYGGTVTEGTGFYLNDGNINDTMRFSMTLTRLVSGDLLMSATMLNLTQSNSYTLEYTLAEANLLGTGEGRYTFDVAQIGFRRGGSAQSTFDIDNVLVEVIPEPSTFGLLLAGMATMWLARGRNRKD